LLRDELKSRQNNAAAHVRRRFLFPLGSARHGHGLRMPSFDRNVPLRGS
jgi:hypothetical protein